MNKKDKLEILKNNVRYLIKSRGETQLSLCNSSGLTRTTIYNLLEGRVVNVQHSTIRKISDFFGVCYREIETTNFEEKELIENSASPQGNMNPAAVPIIKEAYLIQNLDKRIGELSVSCPLTYYFGVACNLIGVLLENAIDGAYDAGDLLIVKKGSSSHDVEKLIYEKATKKFFVVDDLTSGGEGFCVVGDVIEERFNGK